MHWMKCLIVTLVIGMMIAAATPVARPAFASVQSKAVTALPHAECADVRHALEDGIPIEPAFRQMEYEFPENPQNIKGGLCRLKMVSSGTYIENTQIRSLADMHAFIKASLERGGWRETEETRRFVDRSQSGKDVFALFKNNAICVATTLISPVPGYVPTSNVKADEHVYLGSLFPYEREWWISVDCFHL